MCGIGVSVVDERLATRPDVVAVDETYAAGSDCLILDTRFMVECGLEPGGRGVTAREGVDETGHSYVRFDATLAGAVHLQAAPETSQEVPRAMFQEIIHDGLVGSELLYRYRFSFDLAGGRMILGKLSHEPPGR